MSRVTLLRACSSIVFCFLVGLAASGMAAPALDCPPCDDGNACTIDSCDPATGICRNEPVSCDDGNACTTDTCDSSAGCVHEARTGSCDTDPRDCQVQDCVDGTCQATLLPVGSACDDKESCTASDACDPSGNCVGLPLPPGSECYAGNPCTIADRCATTPAGTIACVPGDPKTCSDGDACTTDACDPASGLCVFRPIDCNDHKACTQDECSHGVCQHVVLHLPCSDHNACTLEDRTECGPNGEMICVGGKPLDCHIFNDCFSSSCDPAIGCVQTYRCDDHNPCTLDSCNYSNFPTCQHTPLSGGACDDGNPCTNDSCDPAIGCVHRATDADSDSVPDSCDNCPSSANPDQADADSDGVGDVCDNCAAMVNPGQEDCDGNGIGDRCDRTGIGGLRLDMHSPLGHGSGVVSWRTVCEVNLRGFDIVVLGPQEGRTINRVLIPCEGCDDGASHAYTYLVPKHRSPNNIYLLVHTSDGTTQTFGPADRP